MEEFQNMVVELGVMTGLVIVLQLRSTSLVACGGLTPEAHFPRMSSLGRWRIESGRCVGLH